MTRTGWRCLASCLYIALFLAAISGGVLGDEWEAGEVQVKLKAGVSIQTINQRYGTTTLDSLPPLYLLAAPTGQGEDGVIQQMDADLDILEAEYSFNNETPEGTRQMTVAAVGGTITDYLDQNLVARLRLAEAHQHSTGEGVVVAVVDTGVLASHPALAGVVLQGYDFVALDADPTDAADGMDGDGDGATDEGAGHGTMVAGIIHLVAPSAQILPIRVLDDEGRGETFAVAKGIQYALEHGADVINLSLGLNSHSFILGHEVDLADSLWVPLVAATGNDSLQALLYPARDHDVIGVTALDSADVKAGFANWHSDVAVAAPGIGIYAPYYDGGYAIGAGTSFSAPFISGQCALIRSLNPALSKLEIVSVVRAGVTEIYQIPENEPFTGELGTGRFDALVTFEVTPGAAGVGDGGPAMTRLCVNPNPSGSRESVTIQTRASVDHPEGITLVVCDAAGRVLRRLGESSASSGSWTWDGRDTGGRPVPAGTYFLRDLRGSGGARIVRVR